MDCRNLPPINFFSLFFFWRQIRFATMPTTTTLKTLRLQYGQIPMQYEVQHCTFREHEDADPDMVGARRGRAPPAGFDTLVASASASGLAQGAQRVCVCAHARCMTVFAHVRQLILGVHASLYSRARTRPRAPMLSPPPRLSV